MCTVFIQLLVRSGRHANDTSQESQPRIAEFSRGKSTDAPLPIYVCVYQVFEEILSEQQAAPVTGVLIVQKESVIHLVETSMDTSTAFLRQIQSMEAEPESSARVMENVSVVRETQMVQRMPRTYTPRPGSDYHESVCPRK